MSFLALFHVPRTLSMQRKEKKYCALPTKFPQKTAWVLKTNGPTTRTRLLQTKGYNHYADINAWIEWFDVLGKYSRLVAIHTRHLVFLFWRYILQQKGVAHWYASSQDKPNKDCKELWVIYLFQDHGVFGWYHLISDLMVSINRDIASVISKWHGLIPQMASRYACIPSWWRSECWV